MDKFSIKTDLKFLIVIAAAAAAVFASSLNGNFVYDDNRQILENPLIQNSSLYGKALVSDVWAFKGDGSMAASNYWRPTFTALSILCFWLFGPSPFGWHLVNVLLHIGVCLLGFVFLRNIGLKGVTAGLASVIFAVHPVHTESVAWIAGSPDLLFGVGILGSLIFADREFCRGGEKPNYLNIAGSIALFAFALGSKEVALLCIPLYYLLWRFRREDNSVRAFGFGTLIVSAAAVGTAYFAARWYILGTISRPAENAADLSHALLSVPAVLAFYLKQALLPITFATNYPLRAVTEIGLSNFILPLVVVMLTAGLMAWLWRKASYWPLLIGLFALPLLPALNIGAFIPEQIVHDRYLYLPLLGAAAAITIFFDYVLRRTVGERSEHVFIILFAIVAVALGLKTVTYSQSWQDELSLWKHSVTVDDRSAFNWSQLGAALAANGALAESIEAYDRSIGISPTPIALMGRARGYIAAGRLEDAIRDATIVTKTPLEDINAYTLFQGYETLGLAYDKAGDAASAEATFREGRRVLPIYSATLTEKLAVVLYVQGKKQEALNELVGARDQAGREMLGDSKAVYFRLGLLYAESGNNAEARRNFQEFLAATETNRSTAILSYRKQAASALSKLK
jgi:tetratricopeptide (TPR) repeat protein